MLPTSGVLVSHHAYLGATTLLTSSVFVGCVCGGDATIEGWNILFQGFVIHLCFSVLVMLARAAGAPSFLLASWALRLHAFALP